MQLAEEWSGNLMDLMEGYSYQTELTRKLDGVSYMDFDQALIKEIVSAPLHSYLSIWALGNEFGGADLKIDL